MQKKLLRAPCHTYPSGDQSPIFFFSSFSRPTHSFLPVVLELACFSAVLIHHVQVAIMRSLYREMRHRRTVRWVHHMLQALPMLLPRRLSLLLVWMLVSSEARNDYERETGSLQSD